MSRMTLQLHKALRATLQRVAELHPDGVLMFGIDNINQQTFCQIVKINNNIKRLLACTHIDIKGVGFYSKVEEKFVSWLKEHIRTPSGASICNSLLSPHNWLKYNIAGDLSILHLGVANIDYYMILKEDHLRLFRQKAFNNKEIKPSPSRIRQENDK